MLIEILERAFYKKPLKRQLGEALAIDLAAIFLWRGTWGLMDLYLFPDHQVLSLFFSIALGLILIIFLRTKSRH